MTRPTLYLDLGSPYAYLAAERAQALFSTPVAFQPVLLGAIFQRRGWGSWADTERRAAGMSEVEERARRYGLAPVVWPQRWPVNALAADRAATWAAQRGAGERFIQALFRRQFARGEDISDLDVLRAAAAEADLAGEELVPALRQAELKDVLRRATDEAWELGVRGVPTMRVGDRLFYGDDRLDEAAR